MGGRWGAEEEAGGSCRVGERNDIGEIHAEMAGAQSAACQGDGVEVEEKLPEEIRLSS